MKTVFNHSIRLACLAALLACSAPAARAQSRSSKLPIENLEGLTTKADRVVDVTLDENLLRFIPAAILKTEKNAEDAKKYARIASGFKGVYVRSFKFDGEGQWKESDIAAIRDELHRPGSGWTRIVGVRNRRDGQNVEVYLMTDPTSLGGLAVLATEPTELTVVNIVGRISLEDFVSIQGRLLDFPDLGIELGDSKDERKPETKPSQPAAKKP